MTKLELQSRNILKSWLFSQISSQCLCSLYTFAAGSSFESLVHFCSHTFHFVYTFYSTFDAHDSHSMLISERGSVIQCNRWISYIILKIKQFFTFVINVASSNSRFSVERTYQLEVSPYDYKDRSREIFSSQFRNSIKQNGSKFLSNACNNYEEFCMAY